VSGVGKDAPQSSFRAMSGAWHPDTDTAYSKRASARFSMSAGSAGSDGVPTRLRRYMSQWTVPAPAARASVAIPVPPVAMTTPGRAKRSCQNDTEPSAKSIQVGCASGSPHERAARVDVVGHARIARPAATTAMKALHTGITGSR
jgi:hypothetical protein